MPVPRKAAEAVVKFGQLKSEVDRRRDALEEGQHDQKRQLLRVSENLRLLINANEAVVRGDVSSAVLLCALTSLVSTELRAIADDL